MESEQPSDGAFYVIRIRENLDPQWAEWFETMTIHNDNDGSLLAGHLADQSALYGVIAKLYRLGLHLVAVNQGEPPSEAVLR
jgi:hypothetical protein